MTVGTTEASVPAAPSFDFVEAGGAKQLRMLWTLTNDGGHHISHFELQRSTDSGTTWVDAGNVPPVPDRSTIWYDSGLAAGTAYAYRVRAIADGGYEGDWSGASRSATTLATADEIPAAPERPTVSLVSGNAQVSWTAPTETGGSDILAYLVRRRFADCDEPFETIAAPGAASYVDGGFGSLRAGIHLYSVRAINTDNEEGPWSLDGELHTDGTVPVLAWKRAFCPAN